MPKRWPTPRVRFWVYQYLVARDGEKCLFCGKRPSSKRRLEVVNANVALCNNPVKLEIDHIDNVALNNDPKNLCLLCSSCNKKTYYLPVSERKRIINKARSMCACVCVNEHGLLSTSTVKHHVDYVKGSKEMQANAYFELGFREWILAQVKALGSYPKDDAINSGAEIVGCSPETSKRFLVKLSSEAGVLEEYKNSEKQTILRFKPDKRLPAAGPLYIDDVLKDLLAHDVKKPKREP